MILNNGLLDYIFTYRINKTDYIPYSNRDKDIEYILECMKNIKSFWEVKIIYGFLSVCVKYNCNFASERSFVIKSFVANNIKYIVIDFRSVAKIDRYIMKNSVLKENLVSPNSLKEINEVFQRINIKYFI